MALKIYQINTGMHKAGARRAGSLLSPPLLPFHPRFQRRAHFFVEHEHMLDALALGGEAGAAVEPVGGAVEGPVSAAQVRRHQVGVVEIGQRRLRMGGASVEHGLGQLSRQRAEDTGRQDTKNL